VDGQYHCVQAKRHRKFGAAKLRGAVDLFLDGSWAARAARFTIAVQASLRSTAAQEEIERQTARLAARGIRFAASDCENLTDRLRDSPELVDDFFGRPWVEALLGDSIAEGLGPRLDGAAFARIRSQLAGVYQAQFQSVDPGSFGSIGDEEGRPALTLLERFLKPDMLVRDSTRPMERTDVADAENRESASAADISSVIAERDARPSPVAPISPMRRVPVSEWLANGHRLVVLGDAGCGKSTLLRVIALDLLLGQSCFPELAARWGQHIPIYIPFARWSVQVAHDGHSIGIKEMVRRSLEQFVTTSVADQLDRAIEARRVLLLIDGLDEWSNEQAARTTVSALVTIVEAHSVPAIVSGRPRGLTRISALPADWKRGTIAPLSSAQQSAIAERWFGRYATSRPDTAAMSDATLRTKKFVAELARDGNLGTLAEVPLLLIGLITLALRGQILPRTKTGTYDQLVRVLLEAHPYSRATASGDTEPRFRHAIDPEQRRAAIAALAYAVREQAGGAGMILSSARNVLRTYFASPEGFGLADSEAAAAAGEILSVNSETQGLIVEKAPGEIGFVHASFEEFLSAEHVGSWPFSKIETFVRLHAGDAHWRNVIANLLGQLNRSDEFDRLVTIIEEPCPDELVHFHRQALLGEVAFVAMRATKTVKRLALATMRCVETEDWLPARREALASVLKGLPDPAFKPEIEHQLTRWLPSRLSYRQWLIGAFSTWSPTDQLQNLLFQSMHDEDRGVQRAAAATYAKVFVSSSDACNRLLKGLAGTRDLTAAAALLESLALGWPEAADAASLFTEAWHSRNPELRLVGILGLATTGAATDEMRDTVLRTQNFWSEVSHPYRELAAAMLMNYWSGDETLIKSALTHADRRSLWEFDTAIAFLMSSSADRADVRAWILAQFKRDHPFNVLAHGVWSHLGRFAAADPEIRAAANAYWCVPKNRLINLHKIRDYVVHIADSQLATMLIEALGEKSRQIDRHWALIALLSGWGRDHHLVKPAIDALWDETDNDLEGLVALIPEIMADKVAARRRLIRMGARPEVRRDLLAIGLEACGCDETDDEAVEAILAFPEKSRGLFDPSHVLFRSFGAHSKVRALALERISIAEPPLPQIAACYVDDPEFGPALFSAATPLPVDLRAQIVEVAAAGAAGTALEAVLGEAMIETNSELRARMVIAHCRSLSPEAQETACKTLLAKATALGPDYESIRAAALAGLATMGALGTLAALEDRGKPVALETGNLMEGIPSVERLICERFAEFEAIFGDNLPERFNKFGQENPLAEILSVAPGASPAARVAFLKLANLRDIPLTPRALRALATELPRSELLLARCWEALETGDYNNRRAILNAEIGLIMRENFRGNASVRGRLISRYQETHLIADALPLAIFAPDAEELPFPLDIEKLGLGFGDWAVAVHAAARRATSMSFCSLLEAMVCRKWRSQFDAQQITNQAVDERLQRDPELISLMNVKIGRNVDPTIFGSFARYLAAAGKLEPSIREKISTSLNVIRAEQRLPIAGYDAVSDQWRALRATLLDALSAGIELA